MEAASERLTPLFSGLDSVVLCALFEANDEYASDQGVWG